MDESEIINGLQSAIREYDREQAALWAQKAVNGNVDPIKMIDALTEEIRRVGDEFGQGECWLPDLIGAADAMQAALPIIEEDIKKKGAERKTLGVVVSGTVFGDIHNIGKTMVNAFLTAAGFKVYDLGVNIPAEGFIAAIQQFKPDILAMSALMTMTSYEMMKVIAALNEMGLRDKVKVIVGGGAITEEFAKNIGADGYDPTAPGAVRLAKQLIGIE